ncbi:MAG TPA: cation transporter [Cyclobacteriaceae bacterium]
METIKKAIYLVEGMTCSGCERTVQKVVENLEGVKSSKADLKSSTVSVEYDPSKVSIHKIKSAVDGLGYKFVGERPANGRRDKI